LQFVFEGVAGQGGVVDFHVDLEIVVQAVGTQETNDGFSIDVVLVLSGFHGFGFNQEDTFETFGAGVVTSHCEHGGQVLLFTLHIGVQQAHVAFTTTPEHITTTT